MINLKKIFKLEVDYSFGLPAFFEKKFLGLPKGSHEITLTYWDELGERKKSRMVGENRHFFLKYLDHLTRLHPHGVIEIEVTPYSRNKEVAVFEQNLKRWANLAGVP